MSAADRLRSLVIAAGIGWAGAFIVVGLGYRLQLYGDGAIFSYAVAVQDVWAFHWHNISGRLAVYVFSLGPAEAVVALTGSAAGGIFFYGLLWFAAPLVALAATFAADRSTGRVIFSYACFSTALLCPLVFAFPTEMWLAHALFWPALAVSHHAGRGIGGTALVFAALLALILTHEGAVIFAAVIVATLAVRGPRDRTFLRVAVAFGVALAIWIAVKLTIRPDDYIASVLDRAASNVFDVGILNGGLVRLLAGTLLGYGVGYVLLLRLAPAKAHIYAASIVAVALAIYWLGFDHALHATDRYFLRTALVIATPVFGLLAVLYGLPARPAVARVVAGVFVLVMLVHIVETAKFVTAWTRYKAAVLALSQGQASDPVLGDPQFVSSARLGPDLNRLSWFSTTPYLSVIVSDFNPARLAVDPSGNYFWLSCATATASLNADRAVPVRARSLVRTYACLHRK